MWGGACVRPGLVPQQVGGWVLVIPLSGRQRPCLAVLDPWSPGGALPVGGWWGDMVTHSGGLHWLTAHLLVSTAALM